MGKRDHGMSIDSQYDEKRHAGFQAPNPASMSEFELSLVAREKAERYIARTKYEAGIQGRDGGCAYPSIYPGWS